MNFATPLIPGKLIKRYKRFLADIELESGEVITAHCANPGAMLGIKDPGLKVWVSFHDDPNRKLKYSWQLVEVDTGLVGTNTALPNALAEEAILAGKIKELKGYAGLRREVKYGKNSRIDLLLSSEGRPDCYVEVKNVHLKEGAMALFPDSVTTRGTKHLRELAEMVKEGKRAVMLYAIQRKDCQAFGLAEDIDPEYAKTARQVFENGVEAYAYDCCVTPEGIEIADSLPIKL